MSLKPVNNSQGRHWETLYKIAENSTVILDKSDTGTGKSYGAMSLVQRMGGAALVLCPPSVVSTWKAYLSKEGIPYHDIVSYDAMRPQSNRESSKMMQVTEWKEAKRGQKTVNIPVRTRASPAFVGWLQDNGRASPRPLVLIVDEYQKVKNDETGNFILVRDSIQAIRDFNAALTAGQISGAPARALMLSATPYDKPEHALAFLRTIGAVKADSLWQSEPFGRGIKNLDGWGQLLAYGKAVLGRPFLRARVKPVDIDWFNTLRPEAPHPSGSVTTAALEVSIRIIEPAISSSRAAQRIGPIYNIFYKGTSSEDEKRGGEAGKYAEIQRIAVGEAIDTLASAVGYKGGTEIDASKGSFGQITKALEGLEIAKLPIFVRLASNALNADPGIKVIIMLNYLDNVSQAEAYFRQHGFNPQVIRGGVTSAERDRIKMLFNSPDNQFRLMIASMGTIKEGQNLHDLDGRFPRYSFISPSYAMIPMMQAAGRADREGSKSIPQTFFVYAHTAKPEQKILEALMKKKWLLDIHRGGGATIEEVVSGSSGAMSARTAADVKDLNESSGATPEETAEPGSASNPNIGDFKAQVDELLDENGNMKVVTTDEAVRHLMKYYGVQSPAQAIRPGIIEPAAGLVGVGALSARGYAAPAYMPSIPAMGGIPAGAGSGGSLSERKAVGGSMAGPGAGGSLSARTPSQFSQFQQVPSQFQQGPQQQFQAPSQFQSQFQQAPQQSQFQAFTGSQPSQFQQAPQQSQFQQAPQPSAQSQFQQFQQPSAQSQFQQAPQQSQFQQPSVQPQAAQQFQPPVSVPAPALAPGSVVPQAITGQMPAAIAAPAPGPEGFPEDLAALLGEQ